MLVKWLIYKSYGLRSRFILQAMGAIERLKPAPRGPGVYASLHPSSHGSD